MFDKTKIDTVIYHRSCPDGMGSAVAVKHFLLQNQIDTDVTYIGVYPGSEPPNVTGANVLVCDISFSLIAILQMINDSASFLIIDHHITGKDALGELDNDYKIFDMTHSAAYLTWVYLFGDHDIPMLIRYIQDRDIWTNEMPLINEFVAWFYSPVVAIDLDTYQKYLNDDIFINGINSEGKSFLALQKSQISQLTKNPTYQFIRIGTRIYLIASVNSTIHRSDVGNKLLSENQFIDFSIVYSYSGSEDKTYFSLRSSDNHTDVARIAKSMGGGGHRNASGISMNGCHGIIGTSINMNFHYLFKSLYWSSITLSYQQNGSIMFATTSIVYFNTPIKRKDFGRYLVQVKTEKDDGTRIQNSRYIANSLIMSQTAREKIIDEWDHIAALWYYDGSLNRTYWYIVINADPTYTDLIKSKLCPEGKTQFYYEGLHTQLKGDVAAYPTILI